MWRLVIVLASVMEQVLTYVVSTPLYMVRWTWGILFEPRDSVAPELKSFTPKYGKTGSQVTLTGPGLHGATVTFGGVKANVKAKLPGQVVVWVPKNAAGQYAIVAEAGGKKSTAPGKYRVLSSKAFTFRGGLIFHGATILNSIVPSSLNQKYLVLMVKPKNVEAAVPPATLSASLKTSLEECSKFWFEASYGKTSFTFEITPTVLDLEKKTTDYWVSTPKTIDGAGANFPVTFAGGETLIANGDGNFTATVTFPAATLDLLGVVSEINKQFKLVSPTPPIRATTIEENLRLRTEAPGAAAKLDLDPASTALNLIGLGPTQSSITPGDSSVDDRWGLVTDALTRRVKDMTDDEAQNFLSGFSGVMVAVVTNNALLNWPRAIDATQFEVRGKHYEFSGVVMYTGINWQCIAHEVGHNMGFPDLYDPTGKWPETEPGRWDIMDCSWQDVHPSTWIKNYMTLDPKDGNKVWLPDKEIEDLPKATETQSKSVEVLLVPIESPLPASNPFEVDHPGVPLRHAIRIKLDENRALLIENRQPGGYNHATLGAAKYSTELQVPAGGIVVTDTINKFPGTQNRSNVIMASPIDDSGGNFPDVLNEEVTVFQISTTAAIKVKITKVIGSAPIVYKVRATWEKGTWVDPHITPWNEVSCETPDIWVDTELDNKLDEYSHKDAAQNPEVLGNPIENGDRLRKGFPALVYARIRNSGKTNANGVVVKFFKVVPPGIGPTTETEIGTATIDVPGNGFALAKIPWTPAKEDDTHACIKVSIDPFAGELNPANNIAQENFTDWFIEAASPYEPVGFEYEMANPLPHRALVRMEARGLKPGWFLDVDPLEAWLKPGQKITGFAAIRANQTVPFEDKDAANGRPRISLLGRLQKGCRMVPFGGIAGTAHAVRKAEISGKVAFPNDKTASISANAKTKEGPVDNTNVTVVFMAPGGKQLFMTRIKTNTNGDLNVPWPKPENFPADTEFMVDLLLSPSPGTGPAETRLKFKFPSKPPVPPVAKFLATPEFGTAPMTVQFSDNSSGEITSRSWEFGDGTSGSGLNPSHVYSSEGSFKAKLSVSGPNGTSSAEKMIVVNPKDPLGGGGNGF